MAPNGGAGTQRRAALLEAVLSSSGTRDILVTCLRPRDLPTSHDLATSLRLGYISTCLHLYDNLSQNARLLPLCRAAGSCSNEKRCEITGFRSWSSIKRFIASNAARESTNTPAMQPPAEY